VARRGFDRGWYPPSTPRAVEGGLKAKTARGAIGSTWWSRRFLDVLESFAMGGRLILPDALNYPEYQTEWAPDADSEDSLAAEGAGPYGGTCPADGIVTGPYSGVGREALFPSSYCLR